MTRSWPFIVGMTLPTAWRLELEWPAQQRFCEAWNVEMVIFKYDPSTNVFSEDSISIRSPPSQPQWKMGWCSPMRSVHHASPFESHGETTLCANRHEQIMQWRGHIYIFPPHLHILFVVFLLPFIGVTIKLLISKSIFWVSELNMYLLRHLPVISRLEISVQNVQQGCFSSRGCHLQKLHLNLWNGGLLMVVHDSS